MKYLILIHGNPASRAAWAAMSAGEQAEGLSAYAALNEALAASGELIVAEALADSSHGVRLPATETWSIGGDGPFAEAKEQLAGFYLIDCDGIERAMEIAAQVPESSLGLVEVRPIMTYSAMEG